MKISGENFFDKFVELFQNDFGINANEILSEFKDNRSWTKFILSLISRMITELSHGELECKREFYKLDLCVYDKAGADPYNKTKYRQPLYVHAIIEHENARNSEEEFWKLLHWYSPLKVLIAYPKHPDEMVKYFSSIKSKVNAFHPRSQAEEYLVIFGQYRMDSNKIEWEGWLCRSNDLEFKRITFSSNQTNRF